MRYYQQEKKAWVTSPGSNMPTVEKDILESGMKSRGKTDFNKKQLNATAPGLIDQLPNEEIQM